MKTRRQKKLHWPRTQGLGALYELRGTLKAEIRTARSRISTVWSYDGTLRKVKCPVVDGTDAQLVLSQTQGFGPGR